jgi:5-methylcytosine-specific restriction endonuclease McrA
MLRGLPEDLAEVHEDHIIPRSRGGPASASWNIQILHALCNERKREHLTPLAIALAAEHGITIPPATVRHGRGPTALRHDQMLPAAAVRLYAM